MDNSNSNLTVKKKGSLSTMKIVCKKSNLLNGVQNVSKAVPVRTTMSILECILVDASQGEIKLTANDMEIGIETIIDGTIEQPGKIALEAKIFIEIVKKLPDNDIIIETDEKNMTYIKCENSNFNLVGKSGDDYTYLPKIEKIDSIVLSQFTLKEIIRQTIFSIGAAEGSNKLMAGELFEIKDDVLKVVALDGHRIAVRKVKMKNAYDEKKVIVPGKALNEISKILPGDTDKDVEVFFTDKHIVFEFNTTTVVARLLEGEYFNINQMLSSDYETKMKINKNSLFSCIDRATLLASEGNSKPVIMQIEEGKMLMNMNSAIGSMSETIDIEKTGKDLVIGFNPKFLMDALKAIDDEIIDVYLVNSKAPCYIKNADETYNYMVLPVNFTTVS